MKNIEFVPKAFNELRKPIPAQKQNGPQSREPFQNILRFNN